MGLASSLEPNTLPAMPRPLPALARIFLIALTLGAIARSASAQGSLEARLEALESAPPAGIPSGTLVSIRHLLDTAGRMDPARFEEQAAAWRRRAGRYLDAVEAGHDPYPAARGEIVNRGYRSPLSTVLQGYAIYVPPDYDPTQRYPLYLALHGGSSNGNLFLGVTLGNNMSWQRYDDFIYNDFEPRWSPNWIVVAPTGFGQMLWRWHGERDVLDVIADVQRHYSVDPDRVTLGGLSNGGIGGYTIGSRHAWRFAVVQAMAGAPSWQWYVGGRQSELERRLLDRYSAAALLQNLGNTDFRYYHGRNDPGPMRPRYIERFDRLVAEAGDVATGTWYDAGHDLLYIVHRHGRVYEELATHRRDPRPREVHVVSADYRAARQHWLELTRIADYPASATLDGRIESNQLTLIPSDNLRAFRVHLPTVPLPAGEVVLRIGSGAQARELYRGARPEGTWLELRRGAQGWERGPASALPGDAQAKRPGRSGPISDVFYERTIHVYGTGGDERETRDLRRAAERGARGWPLWAWDLRQEVVADTELSEEQLRDANIVLYASPGPQREGGAATPVSTNAVLNRVAGALPIELQANAIVVGSERYEGSVGVRFIYPNPLAASETPRYLVVQAATDAGLVRRGNKLPEFLGDWVVYSARTVSGNQQRTEGRQRSVATGLFDDHWRLRAPYRVETPRSDTDDAAPRADKPSARSAGPAEKPQGGVLGGAQEGPEEREALEPLLPVPPAPPVPSPPTRFAAPASDQAGQAARLIWRRVPEFRNYRAEIAGANWQVSPRHQWTVRPAAECYAELERSGIDARPADPPPSGLVPAPVEILGPIEGVWFRMSHEEQPFVVSCELALRLPFLARTFRREGVRGIEVMSALRSTPFTSFHTMGMGLDLPRFWTDRGWVSIQDDYEATPGEETCAGPAPRSRVARSLRRIACRLHRSGRFQSVLTPNYNEGHRDHFHLDIRPDDPRLFLR